MPKSMRVLIAMKYKYNYIKVLEERESVINWNGKKNKY